MNYKFKRLIIGNRGIPLCGGPLEFFRSFCDIIYHKFQINPFYIHQYNTTQIVAQNRTIKQFLPGDIILSIAELNENIIQQINQAKSPIINRLSGVWVWKDKDYLEMNKGVKYTTEHSDGIIYQSLFHKNLYESIVGNPGIPYTIITNGALHKYRNEKPLTDRPRYICCAASDWQVWGGNKGLKHILLSLSPLLQNGEHKLFVIGRNATDIIKDNTNDVSIKNVINTGFICNHEKINNIFNQCCVFIHLSYIDICPNVVTSAIAAGLPTICYNKGGASEIIGEFGETINIELEYSPIFSRDSQHGNYEEILCKTKMIIENSNSYINKPHNVTTMEECIARYIKFLQFVFLSKEK